MFALRRSLGVLVYSPIYPFVLNVVQGYVTTMTLSKKKTPPQVSVYCLTYDNHIGSVVFS